jgi:hypothetical protein
MKKLALLLGLGAISVSAQAKVDGNNFEYSVFRNYKDMAPVNVNAMQATRQQVSQLFPGWYGKADKLSGKFKDIFGDALAIPGNSITDKANYCFEHKLQQLGVNKAEWILIRNEYAPHASYVDYRQEIQGHKVVFSDLSFRFTTDGKLVRIKMTAYGTPALGVPPSISREAAMRTPAMTDDLNGQGIVSKEIETDWVWFPIPTEKGYVLHPAWVFKASSGESRYGTPLDLSGYIDAMTGELLYRTNEVKEAFNVTVKGDSIYTSGTINAPTIELYPNLQINIGSNNYNLDSLGYFSSSTLGATQNVTYPLQGRWSRVRTASATGTTPSFTVNNVASGTIYTYPNTTPSSNRHTNAYYHVNVVHDFMKKHLPDFTGLDIQLTTVVERTNGSCNAYYNGSSINFYQLGGGCKPFSEIRDVVFHEYGHGISDKFYSSKGKSFSNGAMGEGNSDVWGMCITGDSVLGRFTSIGNPGSSIRRYDQAPKVYPFDIVGEVHADGEIIAGAWWDVRRNVGNVDTMARIFSRTYYDTPNGPSGTEGDVYYDVLVSAILNDDNDANMSNGTPHMQAIVKAFAIHGIYLMSDATLEHTEIPHTAANIAIPVNATVKLTDPRFFGDLKFISRVRGNANWDTVSLTNNGPGVNGGINFTTSIPAQSAGSFIEYYFVIYDVVADACFSFPAGYNPSLSSSQTTIPYQFGIGIAAFNRTDFDGDLSEWTISGVSGDGATQGKWEAAKPTGTFYSGSPVQPGTDHTTGTTGKCLVTGASGGSFTSNDVNGKTTVLSPVYNIEGLGNAAIEYYRWFSNDRGTSANNPREDVWQVQIRDSAGFLWKSVDNTYQSDHSWRRRVFAVSEYLPTSTFIQLRFIATDNTSSPSCVEAGIDDIAIYGIGDTKVKAVSANKAKVFPNPANDHIYITLNADQTGTLSLYDITGRTIAQQNVQPGVAKYSFATTDITAGNYILKISTDKLSETQKIVVKH